MREFVNRNARSVSALCILSLFLLGCAHATGTDATDTDPPSDPAREAPATQERPKQVWLSASHILVRYAGAERAGADVTRTKEEALALARQIADKARTGEDFATLAREHSEGPSAPRGGSLGQFPSGRMVPAFSEACMRLAVGQTSDPVETKFGYHVIRRDEEVDTVGVRHILIMHDESLRKPETVSRTKEAALLRAQEVLKKIASGADFAALAGEYSDGPSNVKGGDLGVFPRGSMVPAFDQAAFALDAGQISEIVETPFGYHILLRYE